MIYMCEREREHREKRGEWRENKDREIALGAIYLNSFLSPSHCFLLGILITSSIL